GGINLTGLGLGGCFSSFLAETRSSQSPTATLSDFVVGPFKTCSLQLPNMATVSADGIAPITSNQVVITVTDGHADQAPAVGSSAAGVLTLQQLQSAVAQGLEAWRVAGIDAGRLNGLANVAVHIADLPGADLGLATRSDIWVDPTAAGWGWSVGAIPAPGR